LLRQTGAPALCASVLLSASLLLLLPPLGVILALVALRRIRASDGRLYGLRGAWASLAANVGMSLWLSVALACNWSEWFGSSGGAGKTGTNPVFPAPSITTSQAIHPVAKSETGAVTTATAPGPNRTSSPGPAGRVQEDAAWFGSGPFSGHWIAQFNFERNTRNTAEPPHPWETFFLNLTQEVHTVRGQMRGKNLGASGRLSGVEADGRFQGAMRLS
jgi:hypothetical protein